MSNEQEWKMASTKKKTKQRIRRKQLPRRDIDSGHNNKNALSIVDLSSAWDTEFVPRSCRAHAVSHIILFSIRSTLSCLDIFLTALFVFLFYFVSLFLYFNHSSLLFLFVTPFVVSRVRWYISFGSINAFRMCIFKATNICSHSICVFCAASNG